MLTCLQPDFRIAVTGSVVELDKAVTIVKKLKLQGTPYKIYKNTAFIQVSGFQLSHNHIKSYDRDDYTGGEIVVEFSL